MTDNKLTIDGFEIMTHHSEYVEPEWIAVNMTVARSSLEGYNLSEDEKTKLEHMLAGYCRLINERGLDGYGNTEFEAIQNLFSKATLVVTPSNAKGEAV